MPALRPPASRVYLLLTALQSFLWAVAFTLGLVYQVQIAHLDPFQLVIVGTVLEATCFLCEVPTGLVADLRSRRASVIIGFALIGAGVLVVGAFPSFGPILVGNVVWGLGYTFISGATEAWIADEAGPKSVQSLFTRGEQLGLVGGFLGIVAAGALGVVSLQAPPLVAGGGFMVLAALLAVVMPEDGFRRAGDAGVPAWRHAWSTLGEGLRAARSPGVVRSFTVIALLTGLTSEVFDRLWADRVLRDFRLPSVFGLPGDALWFTLFALASALLSLIASRIANRFAASSLTAEHPARAVAVLLGAQVLGVLGFALSPWLWGALASLWLRQAAMVILAPVRRAWLNRHIAPGARATTLSMLSQADAVGQAVGGPAFGGLARRAGVATALVASAVVQALGVVVAGRAGRGGVPLLSSGSSGSSGSSRSSGVRSEERGGA